MNFYSKTSIDSILEKCQSIDQFKEMLDQCQETYDVECVDIRDNEVIVVSYPVEYAEPAVKLTKLIQSKYDNNPVVGIVDDIDILIQYPDEALQMLEGMKNKIMPMVEPKPSIILT